MMEDKKQIIVFYSWESDLPKETNLNAIRIAIKQSLISIEEKNDSVHLIIDEATRNVAGSPDIPSTILNKILASDIFICDLTTINQNITNSKKTPNPNVLIELGYAIATKGWDRIIMVFNKNYGNFNLELPFDLEKRRVTPYSIANKSDKDGKATLKNKIETGIITIINNAPPLPNHFNSESIKKEKDIVNLIKIMECIHIPTMDNFINEMPDKIISSIFHFWYSFKHLYDNNSFYIYDKSLNEKLNELRSSWDKSLSYTHLFIPSRSGQYLIVNVPGDVFPTEKDGHEFQKLTECIFNLDKEFRDLITYIRENYPQIDLEEISQRALNEYLNFQNEIRNESNDH